MKRGEIERLLRDNGFEFKRQGKHPIFSDGMSIIALPSASGEVNHRLVKSILLQIKKAVAKRKGDHETYNSIEIFTPRQDKPFNGVQFMRPSQLPEIVQQQRKELAEKILPDIPQMNTRKYEPAPKPIPHERWAELTKPKPREPIAPTTEEKPVETKQTKLEIVEERPVEKTRFYYSAHDRERVWKRVLELHRAGMDSHGIAAQMNREGFKAPSGAAFGTTQVSNALQGLRHHGRLEIAPPTVHVAPTPPPAHTPTAGSLPRIQNPPPNAHPQMISKEAIISILTDPHLTDAKKIKIALALLED